HWHALCTLDALNAGKDVYCEKPVTHLFAEGQAVVQAVARNKCVFQTGSQQRSDPLFRRAVELIRNGIPGDVQTIEVGLPPGYDKPQGDTTVQRPRADLDYEMWCGPSPVLPLMQARHHRWWRGHRAYGGGVLMDWIGHHNDIAHWAMGVDRAGPVTVEATGWTFPETDVYNTPHEYTIRCAYANGVHSTISTHNRQGLKIIGTKGWVWVNRGRIEASDATWLEPGFSPGAVKVTVSDDHVGNFLDCIRTRSECIAPADAGHRSITPGHLAYVSNHLKRKLAWDPVAEVCPDDAEATELLKATDYREPWRLA
ncbi:MAG: Gfo/Idh/MocA family oxidoreductase, partial [Planctomycetaceae bacterium]|nr:Gfo/Idh/MocA family oxidoreductase [Planctomycetaceae bacterium]